MNSTKILLADDHAIMREGLQSMLEKNEGIRVVGEAGDGRTAVRMAGELSPDVVIMDIGMPGLNGVEATRRITRDHPDIKVIILSTQSDKRFVMSSLDAGAVGYVVKIAASRELVAAVTSVCRNQTYLSPAIAKSVVQSAVKGSPSTCARNKDPLSNREREVLQMIAEGTSSKEIAETLNLSELTVLTHRRNLMQKLGLHNVALLTKYAIRTGLCSLDN